MSETVVVVNSAIAALVALVAIGNILLTRRRDQIQSRSTAFEEMAKLKGFYQEVSEALSRQVEELKAKIILLEERATRLEQENFKLRLEVVRLQERDGLPEECWEQNCKIAQARRRKE